jgi:hypothetical protein
MRRRWVTDTGCGFVVVDRLGERTIGDQQVTDVQIKRRLKFSSGIARSIQRKFVVWAEGEQYPVKMTNSIPIGVADPLGDLIERTLAGVQQRWKQCLGKGGTVVGEGWTLQSGTLTVSKRFQARTVALAELGLVGVFDGSICIWREGEEQPLARLRPGGRNNVVLHRILLECVKQDDENRSGAGSRRVLSSDGTLAPQPAGLGHMLFRRRSNPTRWVLGPLGLLGCILGVALASRVNVESGVIVFLLGLVGIAAFCYVPPSVFQCFERGIRSRSLTGRKEIRFEDVQSFTYSAVREFIRGAYYSTRQTLRFRSSAHEIVFGTNLHNQDDDIESLCGRVSRIIAVRLREKLACGQKVRWTPHLAFRGSDLWYRPAGILGRGEVKALPIAGVRGFRIDKGFFFLFADDADRPIVSENVSEPDFFPGLHLLLILRPELAQPGPSTTNTW